MARAIAEGLERVDPQGAETYRSGLAKFNQKLDQAIPELARILSSIFLMEPGSS